MMDDKRSELVTVFGSVLASCGEDVDTRGVLKKSLVMETLANTLPKDWIAGIVLHAGDAVCACEQLISLLDRFSRSLRRGETIDEELVDDIWGIIAQELRYHVFSFCPYADRVREAIFDGPWRGNVRLLAPPRSGRRPRSMLPVQRLTEIMASHESMDRETAFWVSSTLARFHSNCKAVTAAAHEVVCEPDAGIDVLICRFATMESAFLDLASSLLEADVASLLLSRQLTTWK